MQGKETQRKGFHQIHIGEVTCSQICQVGVKRPTDVLETFLDGSQPATSILGVVPWGAWLPFTLRLPKMDKQLPAPPGPSPGHQETPIKMDDGCPAGEPRMSGDRTWKPRGIIVSQRGRSGMACVGVRF